MDRPRFTFCIPNLNKFKYLPACIESVLSQDCKDWRCVFVDGYSTDGSWEYMQQFVSDPRFLLLRGKKEGMYADWNECLKHVETEYFYFLTSDDTCFPELVSSTMAALDLYPYVDACHFQFALINETGDILNKKDFLGDSESIYANANRIMHLRSGLCEFFMHFVFRAIYTSITTLVFRRHIIKQLEGFTTKFGTFGDYDWTMRLCLVTDILYLPKLLATWRMYEGQATSNISLYENNHWSINIARKNLNVFRKSNLSSTIKAPLDENLILSEFKMNDAYFTFLELLESKKISKKISLLKTMLKNYPLYFPKKIINYLSFKKIYYRPTQNELASYLISYYKLNWPPKQLINAINADN
jgi:glycosyltransferase involved in cell wall biosynthesis